MNPNFKDKFLIIICGHGGVANGHYFTAGKRSPEIPPGYYEGGHMRRIAHFLSKRLKAHRVPHVVLNPGPIDQKKAKLVAAANKIPGRTVCINLHSNAARGTGWNDDARGSVGFYLSTAGEQLLEGFGESMEYFAGIPHRGNKIAKWARWVQGKLRYSYLYMLRKTKMPAVLLELGFHTSRPDVAELQDLDNVVNALEYWIMSPDPAAIAV